MRIQHRRLFLLFGCAGARSASALVASVLGALHLMGAAKIAYWDLAEGKGGRELQGSSVYLCLGGWSYGLGNLNYSGLF